ncbi:MAG TPA: YraN family protein, partial [Ruminococcaceae bacterium]|nr:YraN family protein [Oscillospiraceae bacterium]
MDNRSGKIGEAYVRRMLQEKGYRILESNFHSRYGEIDIIAEDGKYVVFVEVKTRAPGSLVRPLEAVTASKRKKIIRTALCYLSAHPTRL